MSLPSRSTTPAARPPTSAALPPRVQVPAPAAASERATVPAPAPPEGAGTAEQGTPRQAPALRRRLRATLASPAALREAIVLHEVLGTPVGLRATRRP